MPEAERREMLRSAGLVVAAWGTRPWPWAGGNGTLSVFCLITDASAELASEMPSMTTTLPAGRDSLRMGK